MEDTVDGSEMWRSPVEVGRLSHYLQGFSTIPGGCLGVLPSTVWLFGLGICGLHISSRDGKPNIIGVMDLETTLGTNFWRNFNQLKFWTFLKGTLPKTNCKSHGWNMYFLLRLSFFLRGTRVSFRECRGWVGPGDPGSEVQAANRTGPKSWSSSIRKVIP